MPVLRWCLTEGCPVTWFATFGGRCRQCGEVGVPLKPAARGNGIPPPDRAQQSE